jgi:ketosteroid isomerase-like protein
VPPHVDREFFHRYVETGAPASTSRVRALERHERALERQEEDTVAAQDETRIRELIEKKAAALRAGDVKTLVGCYAAETVRFSLAPPLRQRTDPHDVAPVERWIATFEAPPEREATRLEITVGGDAAFATSIDRLTATPRGATEPFTLWFRVTLGLRRIDGTWLITHEHESVPFEMDGSFRASVGLQPV